MKNIYLIVLIIGIAIIPSCESDSEAYKRGYKDGWEVGYDKGYKDGFGHGTAAFIKDSWIPTVGGVAIFIIALLVLTPGLFLVKHNFEVSRMKAFAKSCLYSGGFVLNLSPHELDLLQKHKSVQEFRDKVSDILQTHIRSVVNVMDVELKAQMQLKSDAKMNELIDIECRLCNLEFEINNMQGDFTNVRANNHKETITEISKEGRISPKDRQDLINIVNNHFSSKI